MRCIEFWASEGYELYMGTPAIANPQFAIQEAPPRQPFWMESRFRRIVLLVLALVPLLTPVVSPQNDGPFVYSFCMAIHMAAAWSCWKGSLLYPLEKVRWQTVALAQCMHGISYGLAAQRGVAWVSATEGAWLGNACIGFSWILIFPALMGVRSVRGRWVRSLDYLLAVGTSALMALAMGSGVDPGNGVARVKVVTLVVLGVALAALLARATSTRPGIKLFSSVMSKYLLATLVTYFLLDIVNMCWIRSPNILLSDVLIATPELWLCDLALSQHRHSALPGNELEPVLVDGLQPSILAIGGVLLALYGLRGHPVIAGACIVMLMLCYAVRTQLFYHRLFSREKRLRVQANKMEELATLDPLTGIGNRRWFEHEVEKLLRAERSYPCTLVLVDTDRFKEVNDAFGHLVGDEVLRVVAAVLTEVSTQVKRGCCARIGGDEFGLLWPGTDTEEALKLGGMVRAKLAEKQPSDHVGLTVSLGIAAAQKPSTLIELLRRADKALYSAKAAGRNTVLSADDPGKS